jgi:hypothetical protein
MNFIKFSTSAGFPNWPALMSTSTKNTGTLEPEVGLPEELEFGSYTSPTLVTKNYGTFTAPSSDADDLGAFAL